MSFRVPEFSVPVAFTSYLTHGSQFLPPSWDLRVARRFIFLSGHQALSRDLVRVVGCYNEGGERGMVLGHFLQIERFPSTC